MKLIIAIGKSYRSWICILLLPQGVEIGLIFALRVFLPQEVEIELISLYSRDGIAA